MIDTDKYEGHTEGEWCRESNDLWFHRDGKDIQIADILIRGDGDERYHEDMANARLIADAPLLLAEVKRLRELLVKGSEDYTTSYTDLRKIIEDVHWALTGDDVHYSQSDDARITYALGILSEVIG